MRQHSHLHVLHPGVVCGFVSCNDLSGVQEIHHSTASQRRARKQGTLKHCHFECRGKDTCPPAHARHSPYAFLDVGFGRGSASSRSVLWVSQGGGAMPVSVLQGGQGVASRDARGPLHPPLTAGALQHNGHLRGRQHQSCLPRRKQEHNGCQQGSHQAARVRLQQGCRGGVRAHELHMTLDHPLEDVGRLRRTNSSAVPCQVGRSVANPHGPCVRRERAGWSRVTCRPAAACLWAAGLPRGRCWAAGEVCCRCS